MPTFHPTEEMLLDYAAGSLREAASVLMASHLTFCPDCRATVAAHEAIGGGLLEAVAPEMPLQPASIDTVMAAIDSIPQTHSSSRTRERAHVAGCTGIPRPLAQYLGPIAGLDALPWRSVTRSMATVALPIGQNAEDRTRMLRVAGGRRMPRHTHRGQEMILVLQGAFADEKGHYRRGDVAVSDETVSHEPRAEFGDDCICLVVTTGPLKLTGPIGRMINPFVRF